MRAVDDLVPSIARYETALRARFGADVDEDALGEKHERMAENAFLFLRATCWRWAEGATVLCPDLMSAPPAPSVGDAHAGNFGLWFDAEARLVWNINDFDEAARLPYVLDLVRLGASLLLADKDEKADDVAEAILAGYAKAQEAPAPFVLDGRRDWLRTLFVASAEDRPDYWRELADADPAPEVPAAYGVPLRAVTGAHAHRIALPAVAGHEAVGKVIAASDRHAPNCRSDGPRRGGGGGWGESIGPKAIVCFGEMPGWRGA